MRLIYINEIGSDYKGQKQYEFIFSKHTEFDIDEWYHIPASSYPDSLSPDLEYVDLVSVLKNTNIDLDLVQKSDYFGIIDAVDGVISLGWERFDEEGEEDRLTFSFGEEIDSVKEKLHSRGYNLINEELKYNLGV